MSKEYVFGVLINEELQAFHTSKKVIKRYMSNYNLSNPEDHLYLIKIKKEAIQKLSHYEDYFLGECNGTYIQRCFIDVYSIMSNETSNQERLDLEDIRSRLLSLLKGKHNKRLERMLEIVEKELEKFNYTPKLETLKEWYWTYEEFKNKVY